MILFDLFEGLEAHTHAIRFWKIELQLKKNLGDTGLPSCIQEIKNRETKDNVQSIKNLKFLYQLSNPLFVCWLKFFRLNKCVFQSTIKHRIIDKLQDAYAKENKKRCIVKNLPQEAICVDPFINNSNEGKCVRVLIQCFGFFVPLSNIYYDHDFFLFLSLSLLNRCNQCYQNLSFKIQSLAK